MLDVTTIASVLTGDRRVDVAAVFREALRESYGAGSTTTWRHPAVGLRARTRFSVRLWLVHGRLGRQPDWRTT